MHKGDFTSDVFTRATARGLTIHSKDRMYTLFTYAGNISSLSLNESRIIQKSNKILDIQTANGNTVSDLQAQIQRRNMALIYVYTWLKKLRQFCRWRLSKRAWLFLLAICRNSQIIQKQSLNLTSKTSSLWWQLPDNKRYHLKQSHQPQAIVSERRTWRRPCWNC